MKIRLKRRYVDDVHDVVSYFVDGHIEEEIVNVYTGKSVALGENPRYIISEEERALINSFQSKEAI